MDVATRSAAYGSVGLAERTQTKTPRECRNYWLHREVFSANGRIRGRVAGVAPCRHRELCDGVELEVFWTDGLATFHCSYDVPKDAQGRYSLPF